MSDLPITQLSGLQINNTGRYSRLSVPSMTTTQRDALIDITDGIVIYNIADAVFNFRQNGAWVTLGGGGGGGVTSVASGGALTTDQIGNRPITGVGTISLAAKDPEPSGNFIAATITVDQYGLITDATENINLVDGPLESVDSRIAIFDGTSGKLLKDSGVPIAPALQRLQDNQTLNTTLYQISNLGALQFGNSTGTGVTGAILVDSLTPVTFHTQGVGVNAQVCSVFNGELGGESTSPSAILELNTTTGALLLSRVTTLQMNALDTPTPGMIVYNTDTSELYFYTNSWNPITSGGGGVVGPSTSVQNSIAVWGDTTGSTLSGSKVSITQSSYFPEINIHGDGNAAINISSGSWNSSRISLTTPFADSPYIQLIYNYANVPSPKWLKLTCSQTMTDNVTLTFPPALPTTTDQVLTSDINGNLSWVTVGAGLTGSSITGVEAKTYNFNATSAGHVTSIKVDAQGRITDIAVYD